MDERSREACQRSAEEIIGPRYRLAQAKIHGVTTRQLEILECLADGMPRHEIATEMHIGLTTVQGHVGNLLNQLKARNVANAVQIGFRQHFLK